MKSSPPPPAFQSKSSDCTNIEMSAQNTMPPIQLVQPYSARLTSPPSDYLVWSIVSTVCSVIFSIE
jgi:hypothetical protein